MESFIQLGHRQLSAECDFLSIHALQRFEVVFYGSSWSVKMQSSGHLLCASIPSILNVLDMLDTAI